MNEPFFLQSQTNERKAFEDFEQILLSNSGADPFQVAVKLLAAKLCDEFDATEQFAIHEDPNETLGAVNELYKRAIQRWPDLSDGASFIDIEPHHLNRVIRPLLRWKLLDSDLSALDSTLEHLVARESKGALGQYFTPREVIAFCVDVLAPRSTDTVIDPACGSGGFLFESVKFSLAEEEHGPACLGIDFSNRSILVARLMAAALSTKAKINIFFGNSLDGRAYSNSLHQDWDAFLGNESGSKTATANSWGDWNKLGCSVLLANPPFAGDIDDAKLLSAYEAQDGARKNVSREHLFLERAVDMLKPGGRLAIVLPQGLLSNSSAAYLRKWLLRKCRVLAVVGLHPFTFQPHTAVKTAVLFLSKYETESSVPADYPILFACSRSPGKDVSGRVNGVADYSSIAASLKSFLKEQGFSWARDSELKSDSQKVPVAEIMLSEARDADRLDAEHFDPLVRQQRKRLTESSPYTVGMVIDRKLARFRKKTDIKISYADIGCVDQRSGLIHPEEVDGQDAPSRASYYVRPNDVLISTVRPERNVVALVTEEYSTPIVASSGFCVLRAKDYPPELLFAFCKTQLFRDMLSVQATASMYPTVGDKDIHAIPLTRPPIEVENEVIEKIRSGMAMFAEANRKIAEGIDLMNGYLNSSITKNEI